MNPSIADILLPYVLIKVLISESLSSSKWYYPNMLASGGNIMLSVLCSYMLPSTICSYTVLTQSIALRLKTITCSKDGVGVLIVTVVALASSVSKR
jgi:hypothetical protein